MPWTMNDYPSSLKNLDIAVRKKAIDIANAMVDEGYDESRAIPIATRQAKEWYENADSNKVREFKNQGDPTKRSEKDKNYESRPELLEKGEHVVPHDDGWAVQAKDAKQPSDIFEAKSDAVERGKEIARNKGTDVTIHRKDGTIEVHNSYK
ncbi:DUF2188 domain-containing protein [Virgibacillus ihumii]|uniref:DUF2188 domain-containing protein n=1 Tax=Virgibacillus ihumii TaxID=2686091 RepID=UPI00157D921A|nr:DUF2188 domain-containing protein [Virgibacillus ihumii]